MGDLSHYMAAVPLMHQAQIRARLVPKLIAMLQEKVANISPDVPYSVRLYGSLHHGLFVPGTSKMCIDIAPSGRLAGPATAIDRNLLHILTAVLQRDTHPLVRHPILLWHRTIHRPVMLVLFWAGIRVEVTHRNSTGLAVSELMWRVLAHEPRLCLTLLHWKTNERSRVFIGPNAGQVSTYALLVILLANQSLLSACGPGLESFGKVARDATAQHLALTPAVMQTMDPLAPHINLTSRSHQGPELASVLLTLPAATLCE